MLKSTVRDTKLLLLLVVAAGIKVFSAHAGWVEDHYTYGLYPYISTGLRTLLKPLPFSVGDLLYAAAGVYLLYLFLKLIKRIGKKSITVGLLPTLFYRVVKLALIIYIFFNLFWGINYNRQGIAHQLGLAVQPYNLADVQELTDHLQQRLNTYAAVVDTVERAAFEASQNLTATGSASFKKAAQRFSFLKGETLFVKPSLYTHVGHYFGFTGYYNPFSGEAQLKTTIPVFLKPFVTAHEMAHQIGYAKENEANFVAFLASRASDNQHVLYSLYFELYRYALREVYSRDTTLALQYKERLHPRVINDNAALKAYFQKTDNKIEPLMSLFYDQFLKLNQQKEGVQTYNRVVALLVAYRKKYGLAAI